MNKLASNRWLRIGALAVAILTYKNRFSSGEEFQVVNGNATLTLDKTSVNKIDIVKWGTSNTNVIIRSYRVENYKSKLRYIHYLANAKSIVVNGGDNQDLITNNTAIRCTMHGNGGIDFLTGGSGPDDLFGGNDKDHIDGRGGNDYLVAGDGGGPVSGGSGNDLIIGGNDKDSLSGDEGDDIIAGLGGDDDILYGGGSNFVAGGNGSDTIKQSHWKHTGWPDPNSTNFLFGEAGNDRIEGSNEGIDFIFGDDGNDDLLGRGSIDWIEGNDGNDWLVGGSDSDLLNGGPGIDTMNAGEARLTWPDSDIDYLYMLGSDATIEMSKATHETNDVVTVLATDSSQRDFAFGSALNEMFTQKFLPGR